MDPSFFSRKKSEMSNAPKVKQPKLHHYLVAGKVVFTFENDQKETVLGSQDLNGIIKCGVESFNRTQIAKAQQVLQMRFYKEIAKDDPSVKVADVFLYAVSHLGYMTESEFNPPIDPLLEVANVQ